MPKLRNTITVNVPPAKAWEVVGDLASVSRWVPGITSARVEGWRRICATSDGSEIHEEIHDYSDERRSYGYRHTRVPLPVKDSRGTFSVEPHGSGSTIVWEAELETLDAEREDEIMRMIDANYKATLESLRRQIEHGS